MLNIEHNLDLLDKEDEELVITTIQKIQDITFLRLSENSIDNIYMTLRLQVVNGENKQVFIKKNIEEKNHLIIEEYINKNRLEDNIEKNIIIIMLGLIRILDQLRSITKSKLYDYLKEEIQNEFGYHELVIVDNEIDTVCLLINDYRKLYYIATSAYYELKPVFKGKTFFQYKEDPLFVYLFENLMLIIIAMSYNTAKLTLKAFGVDEKEAENKDYLYYFLYQYLKGNLTSLPLKRTKWFYIRKSLLLIPLVMTIATKEILYPALAIPNIGLILYMDYLLGKNEKRYLVTCQTIKLALYITLGMIALAHYATQEAIYI